MGLNWLREIILERKMRYLLMAGYYFFLVLTACARTPPSTRSFSSRFSLCFASCFEKAMWILPSENSCYHGRGHRHATATAHMSVASSGIFLCIGTMSRDPCQVNENSAEVKSESNRSGLEVKSETKSKRIQHKFDVGSQ